MEVAEGFTTTAALVAPVESKPGVQHQGLETAAAEPSAQQDSNSRLEDRTTESHAANSAEADGVQHDTMGEHQLPKDAHEGQNRAVYDGSENSEEGYDDTGNWEEGQMERGNDNGQRGRGFGGRSPPRGGSRGGRGGGFRGPRGGFSGRGPLRGAGGRWGPRGGGLGSRGGGSRGRGGFGGRNQGGYDDGETGCYKCGQVRKEILSYVVALTILLCYNSLVILPESVKMNRSTMYLNLVQCGKELLQG